jgi:hypothetical protein
LPEAVIGYRMIDRKKWWIFYYRAETNRYQNSKDCQKEWLNKLLKMPWDRVDLRMQPCQPWRWVEVAMDQLQFL